MSSKTDPSGFVDLPAFRKLLQELQPARRSGDAAAGKAAAIKRSLHDVTTRLITDYWRCVLEHRGSYPTVRGLTRSGVALDRTELDLELEALFDRSPDYPVGRLRALTAAVSEELCSRALRTSACSTEHAALLRELPNPWFRNYPETHLRIGAHTGISAAFKMIEAVGGAFARLPEVAREGDFTAHYRRMLGDAARLLQFIAASHFDVLLAVEGCIWDSAASMPNRAFSVVIRHGMPELVVSSVEAERVADRLRRSAFVEERLGCPALSSRGDYGNVVGSLIEWCTEIAEEFYLPLLTRRRGDSSSARAPE